jgi:hypothetical protein
VTQKASESDDPGLDQSFQDQALSGLERPTELYVDGAYVSMLDAPFMKVTPKAKETTRLAAKARP